MAARRAADRELERVLQIPKNDRGRRYSPRDVQDLEEERVPWLKVRRQKRR